MEKCWFNVFVLDTEQEISVFRAGEWGHDMKSFYEDKNGVRYQEVGREHVKNPPRTRLALMEILDIGSKARDRCARYIEKLRSENSFESYLITQLLKHDIDMKHYEDLYVLAVKYKMREKEI